MHENMIKGKKEARIGLNSEKDIVVLINTNKHFRKRIKDCLDLLGFDIRGEIRACKDDIKTDIFIEDDLKIGISLKSTTATSFHSLDRKNLENWKKLLRMPDDIFKIIKEAILRVAKSPRDSFILEENRNKIKDFFAMHATQIVNEIFTRGEKELKLLMINDKREHKIYVYKINEVIDFLLIDIRNNIKFSSKGIIRFGNFITVQRKGGDSSHIKISKINWSHPGNQLQFKFSPLRFVEHIEENKCIKYCVI